MRAALYRKGALVVDTLPDPEPGDGQVLVRTLACGICGSDLHALRHADKMAAASRRSGTPAMDPSRDIVFGHEFCAEILDNGPATEGRFKPGARVCSIPVALDAQGVSTVGYSNDYPGGYGELMVLNEALLLDVPNGLSSVHAALTEPMAVGCHAVAKAQLTAEDAPLVIGCGPVGLAVIAALRLRGARPVIAADFSAARRALAEHFGADIVVDPAQESPYERWLSEIAPEGYNPQSLEAMLGLGAQLRPSVIFECVGVPGMLQAIVDGAPRSARVIVAGVCMERDHVEPMIAVGKEINMQFVLGYTPEEFAATLRHIAEGDLDVAPIVTGEVGIDGVARAFSDLENPDAHAKIIVDPART